MYLTLQLRYLVIPDTDKLVEHTLLVTADGVEVLTARFPDSPGSPITIPVVEAAPLENGEHKVETA